MKGLRARLFMLVTAKPSDYFSPPLSVTVMASKDVEAETEFADVPSTSQVTEVQSPLQSSQSPTGRVDAVVARTLTFSILKDLIICHEGIW
jgi:hypothetical protein